MVVSKNMYINRPLRRNLLKYLSLITVINLRKLLLVYFNKFIFAKVPDEFS